MSRAATCAARGRRAFTLLEILIVIAITTALLAISLPIAWSVLSRGQLEATEDQVAAELLKARAHAQETGKAVEVVVVSDGATGMQQRLLSRFFDPTLGAVFGRAVASGATNPKESGSATRTRTKAAAGANESWQSESPLDPAVRVDAAAATGQRAGNSGAERANSASDGFASSGASGGASGGASSGASSGASGGARERPVGSSAASKGARAGTSDAALPPKGGSTRIAVFLPDGSILFGATILLMHESGRSSTLSLDPYTGRPALSRRGDAAPTTPAAPSAGATTAVDADFSDFAE